MEFKQLSRILGKRAIVDPNILDTYSYDASSLTMIPKIALRPHTSMEIKKIIDYANRYNQPIVPRGRGTNNVGGAITTNILVDLSSMNNYKLDLDRGIAELQPGVILSSINLPNGKGFDISPCTLVEPTIAGLIASGIHSRYDNIDDLWSNIIEIEAIDGVGKIYNISDISRLWATEGTTFIITKVKLKIKDINNYKSYTLTEYDSLIDALMDAKHSRTDSSTRAIEVYNPLTAKIFNKNKWLVIKTYEEPIGEIRQASETNKITKKIIHIHEVLASNQWLSQESIINPNNYFEVLNKVNKQGLPLILHYLNGYLHIYTKYGDISQLMNIYEYLLMHSSFPSGHGYGLLKKRYVPIAIKRHFQKLKEAYDYNNILSPGKIINYR